jgi:hypothetical protein
MLLVTNVGFNAVGYWVAHMSGIHPWMFGKELVWTSTATGLVAGEIATMALLVVVGLFVQGRKRDYL